MKTTSAGQAGNLIPFPSSESAQTSAPSVPHEIAHPASRHYPLEDDYISQMLLTEPAYERSVKNETIPDYIHARQEKLQEFLERDDSLMHNTSLLMMKVRRLNEYAKRIRFYLEDLEDYIDGQ